jgi:hypothetical protein
MIVYFQKLKSINLIYYNRTLVDKYGQIYMKKVEELLYTYKQHDDFMNTYGTLVQGLDFKNMGVTATVLTPVLTLLKELVIALTITHLVKSPTVTLITI